MFSSQPRRKIYLGPVILDRQPTHWIKTKRSFASREWFESQVRYGEWIRERNKPNHYLIYATVIEKIEPIKILIKILIKIRHYHTHVHVCHAHVIRKRR
jgi:hypothetical protein